MSGTHGVTKISANQAFDSLEGWPRANGELKRSMYDSPFYMRARHDYLLGSGQPWDLTFAGSSSDEGFIAPLVLHRERHLGTQFLALKPAVWEPAVSSSVCIPFDFGNLKRLMYRLLDKRADWDTFEFSLTVEDLTIPNRMLEMFDSMGLRPIRSSHTPRPFVRLNVPWEVYYRKRTKSFRNDIVRLMYRMERAGGMRLSCVAGDEASNALESLFEFHRKRWAGRGQKSHYTWEHERDFIKALARGSTPEQGLCAYSLFLGEKVIASAVCLFAARKLQYYEASFDPDFSEFSPGKVLVHCIVRDAHEKGFQEIDFGPGVDGYCSYKRWWSTGENFECRYLFSHHRLIGLRLNSALWLEPRILRIRSIAKSAPKLILQRLRAGHAVRPRPNETRE